MTSRWLPVAGGALLLGVAIAGPADAEEQPATNLPPEICDLVVEVERASGNVTVTWSGGTPPFILVRGDVRNLAEATKVEYLSMDTSARRFVDPGAFSRGRRFYYQVYDHNSVPEVFTMTPDDLREGGAVTVRGVGFSGDCATNTVVFEGGIEVRPNGKCSFIGFQFTVPPKVVSGSIMFVSPNGVGGFGDHQSYRCDGISRRPATW